MMSGFSNGHHELDGMFLPHLNPPLTKGRTVGATIIQKLKMIIRLSVTQDLW